MGIQVAAARARLSIKRTTVHRERWQTATVQVLPEQPVEFSRWRANVCADGTLVAVDIGQTATAPAMQSRANHTSDHATEFSTFRTAITGTARGLRPTIRCTCSSRRRRNASVLPSELAGQHTEKRRAGSDCTRTLRRHIRFVRALRHFCIAP